MFQSLDPTHGILIGPLITASVNPIPPVAMVRVLKGEISQLIYCKSGIKKQAVVLTWSGGERRKPRLSFPGLLRTRMSISFCQIWIVNIRKSSFLLLMLPDVLSLHTELLPLTNIQNILINCHNLEKTMCTCYHWAAKPSSLVLSF